MAEVSTAIRDETTSVSHYWLSWRTTIRDGLGKALEGMQIDERAVSGVTVLAVSGEITLSSGGGQTLKERIAALMQQGKRQLVLELGSVTYVDSAGLGQLVQVQLTTAGQGGTLKLANTGPR